MFGFLGDVASVIMTPLYYLVSAVLLAWREIFALVLPNDSGWTWAFAIVGLAVTIRLLLIPMYIRQIRANRAMRELGPQIKELQQRYKHDRERLAQEENRLWSSMGANPYLWWLPLIVQGLVFLVLLRIIDTAAKFAPSHGSFRRGFITEDEAQSLSQARILGAGLADTFIDSSRAATEVLAIVLVLVMCATQFIAQRQQMAAAPVEVAMSDVFAKQRRLVLFGLPVVFAAGGLVLPLGVLILWATSCVWTMGQSQVFYGAGGSSP